MLLKVFAKVHIWRFSFLYSSGGKKAILCA